MSLMDLFKEGGRLFGESRRIKNDRKAAEKDRKERFKLIESMDFEPTYASETTPTFKRTESPVARAYLESFLMGQNPDATFSGAPNAAIAKKQQQTAQNTLYGTPEARAARQAQILQETPWAVTAPSKPVVNEQKQAATWAAKHPTLAGLGVTSDADFAELQNPAFAGKSKILGAFTPETLEDKSWSPMLRSLAEKQLKNALEEREKQKQKQKQGG